ncbi:MAG: hypothetical protein ABIH36_01425 [bacterium]
MNFAVIEYTSKSGQVWRHRPGQPNYLQDPAKVIDPTSFGCYVSALAGEHIPLTKLIGTGSLLKRIIKKLTGSWPQNYSLEYLRKFDCLIVVHQISNAHEVTAFVERLKRELPRLFIFGVPTQPYGILKPHLEKNDRARHNFVEYMNACDVFLTVVKDTKSWYESLTTTPVEYLPQIYPAHFAAKFFKAQQQKDKVLFVAGVTSRPEIIRGLRVARALQKEFPDYIIQVTRIPGIDMNLSELAGANYEVLPFQQWRQHLPELAKKMLVINTDYTLTRGRVQVDCAAVGTPSLGANSDGQTDLYPLLASRPETSVEELVSLGQKLLTDETYYQQTVQTAQHKLQKYDYEESAVRLQLLVKSYRKI